MATPLVDPLTEERLRHEAPPLLGFLQSAYHVPWLAAALDMGAIAAIAWAPQALLKVLFVLLIRPSSYLPALFAAAVTASIFIPLWGLGIYGPPNEWDPVFYVLWFVFFRGARTLRASWAKRRQAV